MEENGGFLNSDVMFTLNHEGIWRKSSSEGRGTPRKKKSGKPQILEIELHREEKNYYPPKKINE